ncbi:hypothetical protein KY289_010507 [Solanum tuberosum]|nr:hypothetical protein KY289_010507 [Solanum tuberosum]
MVNRAPVRTNNSAFIAMIAAEDTITRFLLAGVGNVDLRRKTNYTIVDSMKQIEDAFKEFTTREDIAIALISQYSWVRAVEAAINACIRVGYLYHTPSPWGAALPWALPKREALSTRLPFYLEWRLNSKIESSLPYNANFYDCKEEDCLSKMTLSADKNQCFDLVGN